MQVVSDQAQKQVQQAQQQAQWMQQAGAQKLGQTKKADVKKLEDMLRKVQQQAGAQQQAAAGKVAHMTQGLSAALGWARELAWGAAQGGW